MNGFSLGNAYSNQSTNMLNLSTGNLDEDDYINHQKFLIKEQQQQQKHRLVQYRKILSLFESSPSWYHAQKIPLDMYTRILTFICLEELQKGIITSNRFPNELSDLDKLNLNIYLNWFRSIPLSCILSSPTSTSPEMEMDQS